MQPSFAARCALALACASALLAQADEGKPSAIEWSGEVRAHADARSANDDNGPLAEADRLSPGLVPPQRGGATLEAGLRGHGHGVAADVLLRVEHADGGGEDRTARFNELYASGALPPALGEGWQFSAGKKVVGWDVGYGWRPNDVVEQEERRQLLAPVTPEGRPLLQLEHFSAETAWTLVWVNPTHLNTRRSGADESALALRYYRRVGAADWHGFARLGEHTRGSLGAAVAWVATDALELHGSWRFAQAHDGWQLSAAAAGAQPANPWQLATLGAAPQWLVGGTWTNADQLSLLAEWWHDGSALSNAGWDAWAARNQALAHGGAASTLPAALRTAFAANLAWQSTPWSSANLRRDNLFLRLSWQHEAWQPALDLLYMPADAGRTLTASLAWQGDRLRIEGGWRRYGGPSTALLAQLPLRSTGYLAATWAF